MGRRRYPREFKLEALRQVLEEGRTQREVAQELGISQETLHRWKVEHEADPEQSFPGNGNRKERDRELDELRRKVSRLETESAFLKKVSAYFARGQK
jgi:transposase